MVLGFQLHPCHLLCVAWTIFRSFSGSLIYRTLHRQILFYIISGSWDRGYLWAITHKENNTMLKWKWYGQFSHNTKAVVFFPHISSCMYACMQTALVLFSADLVLVKLQLDSDMSWKTWKTWLVSIWQSLDLTLDWGQSRFNWGLIWTCLDWFKILGWRLNLEFS